MRALLVGPRQTAIGEPLGWRNAPLPQACPPLAFSGWGFWKDVESKENQDAGLKKEEK